MEKTLFMILLLVALAFSSTLLPTCHGLKPEIHHKFREPEKRPPVLVSTFFTLLVASPAILLLTLWSKSVALKLDTLSIKRIIFHTLFLAVFVCYIKFWFGTNMFDTMRYAAPLICALMYVSS